LVSRQGFSGLGLRIRLPAIYGMKLVSKKLQSLAYFVEKTV